MLSILLPLLLPAFALGSPTSQSRAFDDFGSVRIRGLTTGLINNNQYIMFRVFDPNFGLMPPVAEIAESTESTEIDVFCMAMVNANNINLDSLSEEERDWVPVSPSESMRDFGPTEYGYADTERMRAERKDAYRSTIDEDGYITCSGGYSFKVVGDVAVPNNGGNSFVLMIKHQFGEDRDYISFPGQ